MEAEDGALREGRFLVTAAMTGLELGEDRGDGFALVGVVFHVDHTRNPFGYGPVPAQRRRRENAVLVSLRLHGGAVTSINDQRTTG